MELIGTNGGSSEWEEFLTKANPDAFDVDVNARLSTTGEGEGDSQKAQELMQAFVNSSVSICVLESSTDLL